MTEKRYLQIELLRVETRLKAIENSDQDVAIEMHKAERKALKQLLKECKEKK